MLTSYSTLQNHDRSFKWQGRRRYWWLDGDRYGVSVTCCLASQFKADLGGRAIAVEFVKQHAKVVVNHVGHKTAEADFKGMVSELETAGFRDCLVQVKGDITQPDASEEMVQTAVSTFGKLDIFVSNAGICQFADFLKYAATCLLFQVPARLTRSQP